jgi:hypothetical protein
MGRTKHTDAHVPQPTVLEREQATPRDTASAQDVGAQARHAIDPIWRSSLVEYFSLLDEWSQKARRNEPPSRGLGPEPPSRAPHSQPRSRKLT